MTWAWVKVVNQRSQMGRNITTKPNLTVFQAAAGAAKESKLFGILVWCTGVMHLNYSSRSNWIGGPVKVSWWKWLAGPSLRVPCSIREQQYKVRLPTYRMQTAVLEEISKYTWFCLPGVISRLLVKPDFELSGIVCLLFHRLWVPGCAYFWYM